MKGYRVVGLPRTVHRASSLVLALILLGGVASCGRRDVSVGDIDSTVAELPDVPDPDVVLEAPDPPEIIAPEVVTEGTTAYLCERREVDLQKSHEDILHIGSNSGVLWPGALIQSASIDDGPFAAIPSPRSPITVSVDLGIEEPTARVENPNGGTVQTAIAHLQAAADAYLEARVAADGEDPRPDAIPARVTFLRQDVHSEEQAMLSAGISLRYKSAFVNAGMSAAFKGSSSTKSHTLIVRFFQPMYTISFADEELPSPGAFFAESVTDDDINDLYDAGIISEVNVPAYVKSVTYGRMMLFTLTSSEAGSSRELKAALDASYMGFSGEGSMSAEQKSLLQSSSIQMLALGGSQDDALDAIRTGDWQAFTVRGRASTAVPLSYRLNYLKDRTPAKVGDATTYVEKTCTPRTGFMSLVKLESVDVLQGSGAASTLFASSHSGSDLQKQIDCSQVGEIELDWLSARELSGDGASILLETSLGGGGRESASGFRSIGFPLTTNPTRVAQLLQNQDCVVRLNWEITQESVF